jgi:L-ascorbate metabolism protein UlaG (beta-lactamase superfamily)
MLPRRPKEFRSLPRDRTRNFFIDDRSTMPLTRRRIVAAFAAVSALLAGGVAARARLQRYYDGPVSDHFDGTYFVDPGGAKPKSLPDLLRWWASGGKAKWPDWAPSPHSDTPPARVTEGLRISYVGHASLLMQTAGLNILIDPVWSERASPFGFAGPRRVNDPGIPFAALPPLDVVLVSHNHYDHLDVETLSRLAAEHRPRVITPLGNDAVMHAHDPAIAAQAHDWGDEIALGAGVTVTIVPLRHWSARGLTDRNKALWGGFVIASPWGRIYHVADSGYGDGSHFRTARERYGPFRLAVLPIGAYEPRWFMRDQHMNPEESVRAFRDCGAALALAHHHGTFHLTDEAIDAPERALVAARAAAGIAAEQFRTLKPGQVWEL